ncbi:helix-turn-helix domain-containing protein [Bacillus cereus]|uniref:helix-turn-helix domain-containing protein n=1 Tax=Bacillus cereus TaxID=1396 RepID=UPI000BF57C0A|nr:helix-turn-helix domain-containing protein [Bacillus cereus]PFA06614.1 helix-turn-helix domain-containing protein [Bacillus cereus]
MKSTIKQLIDGDRIEAISEEIQFTETQLHESAKSITAGYKKCGQGQPVFDKAVDVPKKTTENPHEFNEEGKHALTFVKMPTNLRYYMYMTDYGVKDSAILMYQLIIDFYNTSKGKAFPSQYKLAMQSGKSLRSVTSTLKALKEVGLIEVRRTGNGSNNEYRPLLPLEPEELFTRYPKALKRLIENNAKVVEKRMRDEERREQKKEANEWE